MTKVVQTITDKYIVSYDEELRTTDENNCWIEFEYQISKTKTKYNAVCLKTGTVNEWVEEYKDSKKFNKQQMHDFLLQHKEYLKDSYDIGKADFYELRNWLSEQEIDNLYNKKTKEEQAQ